MENSITKLITQENCSISIFPPPTNYVRMLEGNYNSISIIDIQFFTINKNRLFLCAKKDKIKRKFSLSLR